jgi:hypothetical protein
MPPLTGLGFLFEIDFLKRFRAYGAGLGALHPRFHRGRLSFARRAGAAVPPVPGAKHPKTGSQAHFDANQLNFSLFRRIKAGAGEKIAGGGGTDAGGGGNFAGGGGTVAGGGGKIPAAVARVPALAGISLAMAARPLAMAGWLPAATGGTPSIRRRPSAISFPSARCRSRHSLFTICDIRLTRLSDWTRKS